VEEGRLLHYGWLIDGHDLGSFPDLAALAPLPDKIVWLHDHQTLPEATTRDLHRHCLQAMLRDAAGMATRAALALPATNKASRRIAEELGFRKWQPVTAAAL
ncbi:MAG: hypothetical protein ACR2P3_05690, partial [Geminicoccaceae bacterium]